MNLRHLRIFEAVCRFDCNITAAANFLHMTQPSVSIAIKEIEKYYGISVFDRLSRRLYLTEAGRELLKYAERILAFSDEMDYKMFSWKKSERIRIGASLTIGSEYVSGYVSKLKKAIPEIDARVKIEPSRYLERKLMDNSLDIAFVEAKTQTEELVKLPYYNSSLVVAASSEFLEDKGDVLSFEEFIKLPFLLRERGSGTREIFDSVMEQHGVSIEPIWEAQSTMALINAVGENMGVSVVPRSVFESRVKSRKVREIKVEGLEFIQQFSIIYHKDKIVTPAMKELIAICRDKL
ncbi:MAG: LysR family transcriptional regulator [Lachnospiraceae bacterium]|nr:LysR family transcriptional regulator [Lachnospiraceae bacterium]